MPRSRANSASALDDGPGIGSADSRSDFLLPRQIKTSGSAATRAPWAAARRSQCLASLRLAALSSVASI